MLTISILHNLFLTEEERYDLIAGEEITVKGIAVPVWFYKGTTSEPAEEIFCNYHLTNIDDKIPITKQSNGFKINLPQIPDNFEKAELSDDEWREMTPIERGKWYDDNKTPDSAENLRNIKDRGSEFLAWRETNKQKINTRWINCVHTVEIRTKEKLIESLV